MEEYDPSSLEFLFHRKILFRMSNSFFTGAQFGETTIFVIMDSNSFLRGDNVVASNALREFRLANKYYNIIDISVYNGTFQTIFARGSGTTLRCSGRHCEFTHCILTLHNGFHCGIHNIYIDCSTPPCRLTTRVNPDPDWYLNMNFRYYFEINDRQYGSSDPDDYEDVADSLTCYDSGIELCNVLLDDSVYR